MALNMVLAVAAIILAAINAAQYIARRRMGRDLRYVTAKLDSIMNASSPEQVLLPTGDPDVQELLNAVNRLLELKRRYEVEFTRTELAMRKMLANISHDLKTPLTVVLGYIEMIASKPGMKPEERERLLSKVQAKAVEIVDLINRFFDLAKLESGDRDFPLTRVNMNEFCRGAILTYYDLLESGGLSAEIDIPDDPVYARGSEEALGRVLDNLLSNALRYGAGGGVIGLRLRSTEEEVFVDVWDRGKGISVRDQRLVFERMYTLEDSRNPAFQGSGLGLTITKRLVEQMGGEISLKSRPHQATVFTVKLRRIP